MSSTDKPNSESQDHDLRLQDDIRLVIHEIQKSQNKIDWMIRTGFTLLVIYILIMFTLFDQ